MGDSALFHSYLVMLLTFKEERNWVGTGPMEAEDV